MNEAHSGNTFHSGNGNYQLPDAKPGENGLIGLLSSSVRKLVKDCKFIFFIIKFYFFF